MDGVAKMNVLLADSMSPWIVVAGLAVVSYLLMRRSYRRIGRSTRLTFKPTRRSVKLTTGGAENVNAALRNSPQEWRRWEVSMHDTARDLSARLDTKMRALEQLIRMADQATAQLDAKLRERRQVEEQFSKLANSEGKA